MYKAEGKPFDELSPEERNALPNFFDDEKPPKYRQVMKDQKYYEECVNGKNIKLDQFMHDVCPTGFFWVMVGDTMVEVPMSWEPGYVNFTQRCYKLYGAFLHSIVSIHPQGLLCVDYKDPAKAEKFIGTLNGAGVNHNTLYSLFGGE